MNHSVIENSHKLIKELFDFNSLKSCFKKGKENGEEKDKSFFFLSLRSKFNIEKEVNSITLYKSAIGDNNFLIHIIMAMGRVIGIMEVTIIKNKFCYILNTYQKIFIIAIILLCLFQPPKSSISYSKPLAFPNHIVSGYKIMLFLKIKQLLHCCYKYKLITSKYSNVHITDIKQMTYDQFKDK